MTGDSRRRTAMEALSIIRDRGVNAAVEQGCMCAGRLVLSVGFDDWTWSVTKRHPLKAGSGIDAKSIAASYFDAVSLLEQQTEAPGEFDSAIAEMCAGGSVPVTEAARQFSKRKGLAYGKAGAAVFAESASGWRSLPNRSVRIMGATLNQADRAFLLPKSATGFTVAASPYIHFEPED